MGRGVFTMGEGTLTFIIPDEAYLPDDTEDFDLCQIYFEDAVGVILCALPDSYEDVWCNGRGRGIWESRHTRVIARNGFVNIGLTEWGDNDLYVSFFPRDDDDRFDWGINPLAHTALQSAHDKVRDRLGQVYPLRIRTSAWTTGPMTTYPTAV